MNNAYIGVSFGRGGLGFNASVSSTYMWGTLSPGVSAESGNGELENSSSGDVVGNTGIYSDETEAYNMMLDQTATLDVETAAWLTDKGVLVSPVEFPGSKNTIDGSSNSYFETSIRGKTRYAHHLGVAYKITGQIHTHPTADHGLSTADKKLANYIGYGAVYTIGPKIVHRGYYSRGNYYDGIYGLTSELRNGNLTIIK